MYGIFPYIYHKNQPNVGKYTSPMDGLGLGYHPSQPKTSQRCSPILSVGEPHQAVESCVASGFFVGSTRELL